MYESPSASVCVYVWDVSHYAGLGVGMCGMWGDVNGDIPGAPSPWTTAENARSMTGGEDRQKREEKRGGPEGRKKGPGPQEENTSLKEEVKTLKEELDTTKKGDDCKSCFQRRVVVVSDRQTDTRS